MVMPFGPCSFKSFLYYDDLFLSISNEITQNEIVGHLRNCKTPDPSHLIMASINSLHWYAPLFPLSNRFSGFSQGSYLGIKP